MHTYVPKWILLSHAPAVRGHIATGFPSLSLSLWRIGTTCYLHATRTRGSASRNVHIAKSAAASSYLNHSLRRPPPPPSASNWDFFQHKTPFTRAVSKPPDSLIPLHAWTTGFFAWFLKRRFIPLLFYLLWEGSDI